MDNNNTCICDSCTNRFSCTLQADTVVTSCDDYKSNIIIINTIHQIIQLIANKLHN